MLRTCLASLAAVALGALVLPGAADAQGIIGTKGHYFVDESGEPFMVVGHNEGLKWPHIQALWKLPPEQADKVVAAYFAELAANGVNTLRIFAEYPAEGIYLQEPDGSLVEENWRRLEHLADLADRHDIYLLVGPWDPFWSERHWKADPLNAANGGPLEKPGDFYRSQEAHEHQRLRLKALIDRLGGRRNILAWEILNEADLWWHPTPELATTWFTEMAGFMAAYETQRWGRRHLIGLSAADPIPGPDWRPLFYEHPLADFASTHLYVNAIADPSSVVEAARQMHDAMLVQMEILARNPRPYLETENGPIEPFVIRGEGELMPAELDARVYAAICWPHAILGGAGQPLRWPYLTPHTLTEDMHRTQSVQARFFERFDFGDYAPFPIAARSSLEQPAHFISAAADENQLIAAIVFDETPLTSHWEITFDHRLAENDYRVEWLDAASGEILAATTRRLAAGEPLALAVPEANSHLVVSLQPANWSNAPDPSAPTAQFNVRFNAQGRTPIEGPVAYNFYNPRWGRETRRAAAGETLEVTLPFGDWRVRTWADGFLPGEATFAADALQGVFTTYLSESNLSTGPNVAFASEFNSQDDLAFWKVATLEGEKPASVTIEDGALRIVNPAGSRSGAMSPRFRLGEGDRLAFEGVLVSYEGHNALINFFGGHKEFDEFVELEVSQDVVKTWASVHTETRRFVPTTVRPPVHVRCEVERTENVVSITSFHDGRMVQEMKNVRSLAQASDVSVFLYGWAAENKWSHVRIEGILSENSKESSQHD